MKKHLILLLFTFGLFFGVRGMNKQNPYKFAITQKSGQFKFADRLIVAKKRTASINWQLITATVNCPSGSIGTMTYWIVIDNEGHVVAAGIVNNCIQVEYA